jgi:hypothetical protein
MNNHFLQFDGGGNYFNFNCSGCARYNHPINSLIGAWWLDPSNLSAHTLKSQAWPGLKDKMPQRHHAGRLWLETLERETWQRLILVIFGDGDRDDAWESRRTPPHKGGTSQFGGWWWGTEGNEYVSGWIRASSVEVGVSWKSKHLYSYGSDGVWIYFSRSGDGRELLDPGIT